MKSNVVVVTVNQSLWSDGDLRAKVKGDAEAAFGPDAKVLIIPDGVRVDVHSGPLGLGSYAVGESTPGIAQAIADALRDGQLAIRIENAPATPPGTKPQS